MTQVSIEIAGQRFHTTAAELEQARGFLSGQGAGPMPPRSTAPASEAQDSSAANNLRLFIERIERLEEEKKGMADDIRDVYSEARSQGYEPKIMRQVVKLRKMESHDRQEMEAILETYKAALGLS